VKPRIPVVVIGAGPVGLAAAAHLLDRGLEPLVLEAGPQVGANIAQWRHVRLFSPWCLAWTRSACACWTRPAGMARTLMRCPPAPTCWSTICNRWRPSPSSRAVSA
jgi:glycine/D-amino acid oxidase-like deaminating enzyme